jgi:hypothetical protein
MTQKVILFNGPPSSGKDTAARICFTERCGAAYKVFDRMSMPIKRAFAATIAAPIDRWGNVEPHERAKDEVMKGFGVSYRQWQIDFSERFMKPLYGEDIFGKLFINRQKQQHPDSVILVPDCSFDIEFTTLEAHFGRGNVFVIKLYREDCDYRIDSRGYLSVGQDLPLHTTGGYYDRLDRHVYHFNNDLDKAGFEKAILQVVKGWLQRANLGTA